MKKRKLPERTCIGCLKKAPKEFLIRFGEGRGAYLCRDSQQCFNLAMKKKAFTRALKGKITNDKLEKIKQFSSG